MTNDERDSHFRSCVSAMRDYCRFSFLRPTIVMISEDRMCLIGTGCASPNVYGEPVNDNKMRE